MHDVRLSGVEPTTSTNGLLIALDPGVSTGVAFKFPDREGYLTQTITEVDSLWDLLREYKPGKLAFETFFTGARLDTHKLHTIELVGSIRGVCYVLGIPGYGQTPASKMPFLQEAKSRLKSTGVRGRDYTDHEEDALAHLLLLEYRIQKGKL